MLDGGERVTAALRVWAAGIRASGSFDERGRGAAIAVDARSPQAIDEVLKATDGGAHGVLAPRPPLRRSRKRLSLRDERALSPL